MLSFVLGLGLGLSLAAPPGPMNALIAKESARSGWLQGMRLGMGAPVADVIWLVVLLFGLGRILSGPGIVQGAAAFGTVLMMFFAYDAWTSGASPAARVPSFWAGLMAALSNPYQAAWWLSGGFVLVQGTGTLGALGLIVGIFSWVVAFSWLMAHGARRWRWFAAGIRVVSTFMLLGFSALLALVALDIQRL